MTWDGLFAQLPIAALIGWAVSVGIPYLSALVARGPNHWVGVATALLSLLDGFLVELSQQGSHYNYGAAAGQAFLVWLTATKWHSKVLAGTQPEATLYSFPKKASAPPQKIAA